MVSPLVAATATESPISDEIIAGREEIFFSDGLAAVPTQIITPQELRSSSGVANTCHPDDVLDDGGRIDATTAFEVFKGKIFFPSSNNNHIEYFRSHGVAATETPVQRLSRLRMEISELEFDIQQQQQMLIPTNPSEAHNVQDEDDKHDVMLLENITQMARDLASRLDILSIGASGTSSTDAQGKAMHASLTNLVQNQMQQITKQHEQPPQHLEKSENLALPRSQLLLEQKLVMLEKIVGTQMGASSSSSIVQRLAEAERLVSCIDKEGIDVLASKAKLIRSDLEGALKARLKLSSSSSGAASSPEDSKIISSLYESLKSVETISSQLPHIVERLHQLAFLHTQAADFATRLTAVEKSSEDLERLLSNLEETLQNVERGCIENLHVMEKNVLFLDERIQKLL